MTTHVSDLLSKIKERFPTKPIPNRHEILYPGHYINDPELDEIQTFFAGRPWNEVSPQDIFNYRHALSFFSPKALAYYVAAWMSCSLTDEEKIDTAEANLIFCFAKEDANLWTAEQRTVICEWLFRFKDHATKELFEQAVLNVGCSGTMGTNKTIPRD